MRHRWGEKIKMGEQCLFFSQVKQLYYAVGSFCCGADGCSEWLGVCEVKCFFSKNAAELRFFCLKHSGLDVKIVSLVDITYSGVVVVDSVELLPSDVVIVPFRPPRLVVCKDLTVWDAALRRDRAVVKDRTVHALRDSWEGVRIGAPDEERLAELDRPVGSESEVEFLLEGLRDAAVVLPGPEGKVLIGQSDEAAQDEAAALKERGA